MWQRLVERCGGGPVSVVGMKYTSRGHVLHAGQLGPVLKGVGSSLFGLFIHWEKKETTKRELGSVDVWITRNGSGR